MNKMKIKISTDLMDKKYPTHMKLMQAQKVNLNVHINDHINIHTNSEIVWL